MSIPTTDNPDSKILRSLVEHVFMPPKLPQKHPGDEIERKANVALCDSLIVAAQDFLQNLPSSQHLLWMSMIKMMKLARRAADIPFGEADLQHTLSDLAIGDVFSMHIRAQNAALIVRRPARPDLIQFEVFEVSPMNEAIMTAEGKLLCSYPGPAIQVPVDTYMDELFLQELSSFLVQMDVDFLPTTSEAGSVVNEVHESAHPRYISELLVGILRGFGQPAVVDRITKRIGDEVLASDRTRKPWRRSPLWLILRVTLQSSLPASSNIYKPFMLFFHAHLLRSGVRRDFPSELLYPMRVKMARRLSKLGHEVSHHIYEFVHDTAKETEVLLSKRWTSFQTMGSISPPLKPEELDFVADVQISLDKSYDYLTEMLHSASRGFTSTPFNPIGPDLHKVHDFTQFTNGELSKAISEDQHVAIADFELSVEKDLEPWIAAATDIDHALDVIASCIRQYFIGAKELYGSNPEDNSMMILTIMDLWVVLDTFAIQRCPLLNQYSPEIPSEFLHGLLLHRSSTLKRALRIEEYLSRRHQQAHQDTSVFSNHVSFAVKYFRTSKHLQSLYDEINTHAQQRRAAKRAELAFLNQKSKSILREASNMDHEQSKDDVGGACRSPSCRKCQLEREAKAPKIHVHEWALPRSRAIAQLAVFELSPPRAFSLWRDMTYLILHDIGMSSVRDSPGVSYTCLDSFSGLRRWAKHSNRVTIGSTTKTFSNQSHYQEVAIPAEETSVLVDNGLSFKLFDRHRNSWVAESFSEASITKLCTPPIPTSSPYEHLHIFASGTQHTPNEIIAAQADCPKEINLHEFIAYAGLRSGPRLQWLNIARELASPSLSLRREEVHTLVTQAAWQLGPLSDGAREWHIDLSISSFGMPLLHELESLLEKIRMKWLEEVTVRTITLITSRLLASTTDVDISQRAYGLLREARNVTYQWTCELAKKVDSTEDENSRLGLQHRLCAYDQALKQLWPCYRPNRHLSSNWHALPRPNSRWIFCVAESGHEVHYDLLTGKLVINGRPSGRLPHKIVKHPTYFSVLAATILDVTPADIPGMEYMTRSTVFGHQILLSWNNENLILQVRKPGDSQILQLIPRSALIDDFPKCLVDGYTHWLDLSTRELEFRPAGSPWTSGPTNWRMYIHKRKPTSNPYPRPVLQKAGRDSSQIKLIDIRSRTFGRVSNILSPLETPGNIVATHTSQTLEVFLPRLQLSFFVNENWELECRTMPGYVIDEAQSCGTMFGLRNKLILRPKSTGSKESLLPRRVIIPQGEISFRTNGDFTNVSINTDGEQRVHWHAYTIDTNLRCLTSNISPRSKLYQCYLHALTSHCLPDPLLGQTGTEEALHILRSASCRSFQRLDTREARLLKLISELSPDRTNNPYYVRSKARVRWKDLPALSQHHDFCQTVKLILDHARALEDLYDQPAVFKASEPDQMLLNRAAIRNKSYYPSDLQKLEKTAPYDVKYSSRDVLDCANAEHIAYRTSWSIWNAQPSLHHRFPDLWRVMSSWDSVGPAAIGISLRYSRYWLEIDVVRDWLVIYDLCRNALREDLRNLRIGLSFCLSAAAYGKSKYAEILPCLMIFALDPRCRDLSPPQDTSFKLSDGLAPERTHLRGLVSQSALPMTDTTAPPTGRWWMELDAAIRKEAQGIADSVFHQWPDYKSVDFRGQRFNKSVYNRLIEEYLQSISRNTRFKEHVSRLQNIMQDYKNVSIPAAIPYEFSPPQFITGRSETSSYSIHHVLTSRINAPTLSTEAEPFPSQATPPAAAEGDPLPSGSDSLRTLIEEFRHSPQPLLQLYGNELSRSHCELWGKRTQSAQGTAPSYELLRVYHDECSQRRDEIFSGISAALAPSQTVEIINCIAGLWPRVTPRSILRHLAQDLIGTLPNQWKNVISLRLLELSSRQKQEELLREIEAIRSDVLAKSAPDWLLIQVAFAHEMISPSSNRSTSLQLNMGEGKSSVIIPLVVLTLANGSNLVRVVTPKPLSNQMFQLLVGRLSGLANRPIFYIPFSRSLRMNASLIQTISGLYERCVSGGGVLVVQPEHILSQRLMHIDALIASPGNSEKRLISYELGILQEWMAKVSRDVLDESDEILHVRYQLVYAVGNRMPVDDRPNRWITTQRVLVRLQAHAKNLCAKFPEMCQIDTAPTGFPIIRVLDRAILKEISSLIVDDALGGRLSNLPLGFLPSRVQEAARHFMAQRVISDGDRDLVYRHFAGTTLLSGILLLRGLLMDGEGVLGYVFKDRRWRVDYGLDPRRTSLAVPYRAKDVPSLRAEFGHPDVAIALTCLSYYYGGLTKDQVLLCFNLLANLDDVNMEYDHWVEIEGTNSKFPEALRQFNGVNTQDENQVNDLLVPLFSKNERVVDFYLSQVVFPRAAREYPSKLPTSAWDLVENKWNVTTGFSGTNDIRYLFPTSITQQDHDLVLGTNALVLQHLLQPENDHYECTDENNGDCNPAMALLKRLVDQDPEIRVLLDIGAQMLGVQNEELAWQWLSLRPDVSAAIFFDDSDHLTVITQDRIIEPFTSSPFNKQLEKCVVYLDDAHTRGTDLKLPERVRAAVTLGPKLTKDRLVQGCMRMRQLGKGHSVMFFAPGDIDRRIRQLIPAGMDSEGPIQVLDILRWVMHGTCEEIRHYVPHWAQQALDHRRRFAAYKEHSSTGNLAALKKAWLQCESQSLEEMYSIPSGTGVLEEITCVPSLSDRIKLLGVTNLSDMRTMEDKEHEVDHEVERENQGQRPAPAEPAQHNVCEDIREFVNTGKLPESSEHILPLLAPIDMAQALDSTVEWSPSPRATADFFTTTIDSNSAELTDYLRPVNWILSSGSGKDSAVVVISPYEANALLPIIRKSKKVRLHVYAPRVAASMRSFSDLTFHSISDSLAEPWSAPAHMTTELDLFAGKLYFDSREDYDRTCVLLALPMAHPGAAEFCELDGFVPPKYRTGRRSPFQKSKILVLKKLMGLRRKGMDYHRTHLGQILNVNPLSEETLMRISP
ncbi:hypothetical protein BC826DRAFT_1158632 [Russula brevipes]|nr:hypothetical protein BC826DRAFT_1158632 [Russula brevipes]